MLIGDPSTFAIESGITTAYKRPSSRALGFFVIHIGGRRYGVCSPNASLLACSFDEVQDRISRRGRQTAPFATEPDAGKIADAFRDAIYAPDHENKRFFGISQPEFFALVYSNHLAWASDGDKAFDDGSYVLHFDVKERVRLIAFKSHEEGYHHNPHTLRDRWLEAAEFYGALEQWHAAFAAEWKKAPKTVEKNNGTGVWRSPPT